MSSSIDELVVNEQIVCTDNNFMPNGISTNKINNNNDPDNLSKEIFCNYLTTSSSSAATTTPAATTTTTAVAAAVEHEKNSNNNNNDDSNDSSCGQVEKSDQAPEILNKFECDVIAQLQQQNDGDNTTMPAPNMDYKGELSESMTDSKQSSCKFVIDLAEDKRQETADMAAKHKMMLERFQNRYQRGNSMSKLEESTTTKPTISKQVLPKTPTNTRLLRNKMATTTTTTTTTRNRADNNNYSKRRSWSPKSFEHSKLPLSMPLDKLPNTTTTTINSKLQKLQQLKSQTTTIKKTNKAYNCTDDEQQKYFVPRSTVMQLAMQKADYVCAQPLVDDFKLMNLENDNVSEAGTYTLDGDNYTEEQKDLMNIDKAQQQKQKQQQQQQRRRRENKKYISNLADQYSLILRRRLADFFVDVEPEEEEEVVNVNKEEDEEEDVGFVTSVTTSGVLAKSPLLDSVFTLEPPEMRTHTTKQQYKPVVKKAITTKPDTEILRTAHTKRDWVQQWARNARAHSLANDYTSNERQYENELADLFSAGVTMTQSLTTTTNNNAKQQQFSSKRSAMVDNNSDTCSLQCDNLSLRSARLPTKIPSPIHSGARARSISTSRLNNLKSPLENVSPIHSKASPQRQQQQKHQFTRNSVYSNSSFSLPPQQQQQLKRSSLICTQLPREQRQNHHEYNLMTASYHEQLHDNNNEFALRMRKNSLDGQQQLQQLRNNSRADKSRIASSRKVQEYLDNDMMYYVQDLDELSSACDDDEEEEQETISEDPVLMSHYTSQNSHWTAEKSQPPLSNTRCNKALLMRIQNSKQQRAAAGTDSIKGNGIAACPNTPEFPRRMDKTIMRSNNQRLSSNLARASEPRDTHVTTTRQHVPNSLAMAKKQLLQSAAAATTTYTSNVRPKYLDISKFKQTQTNNFLRKNDARSTLQKPSPSNVTGNAIKRSPSASALSRNDVTRSSKHSQRSVPSCMTSSGTSLSGAAYHHYQQGNTRSALSSSSKNSQQQQQQGAKEAEMAMWIRRSKYDPMRAVAEERLRKEEMKRLQNARNSNDKDSISQLSYN